MGAGEWRGFGVDAYEWPVNFRDGGVLRVPGDPVGKGRPRFTRTGAPYTPGRTVMWEKKCSLLGRAAWGHHPPIPTQVHVVVIQVQKRPKAAPKSWPPGRVWCARGGSIPDLSNVIKAAEDALQGVAFLDDCVVAKISAERHYGARGEAACVEIVVMELDGQPVLRFWRLDDE